MIVPQKYFDRFPLDSIQLPVIKVNDDEDTFKKTVTSAEDDRSGDRGTKMYDSLVASYKGDRVLALKKFIQAYLASVASVDDLIGDLLDALDETGLNKNTIVVFTSDHGWGMGEKDYLYKNSLWQESTRIPLVLRTPGLSKVGETCDRPVSLVDLYPTLLDLCTLPSNTMKNDKGRPLDGFSLKPLLIDPVGGKWKGPAEALTALYKWAQYYDPAKQNYSLRSSDWRYVRYENGKEELYAVTKDPYEWDNLALDPSHEKTLKKYRSKLLTPHSQKHTRKTKEQRTMEKRLLQEEPQGGYEQGRGFVLARTERSQEINECSEGRRILEEPLFQEKPQGRCQQGRQAFVAGISRAQEKQASAIDNFDSVGRF